MPISRPIDLELIAQRIIKLAEVALLEHLDSVQRSQANGLIQEPADDMQDAIKPVFTSIRGTC